MHSATKGDFVHQLLSEFISEDSVPVPKNIDQAKLMALLSINWLETNAPDQLKPIAVDKAVKALYKDFNERLRPNQAVVDLDHKQIFAFKQAIYGLFASQLGHPKIDFDTQSNSNATKVAEEAIQSCQSMGSAQGD